MEVSFYGWVGVVREAYSAMAHAIRILSVDAIHRAASGHHGMPLGMADVAAVLFAKFLRFSVSDGNWINRDRFVLSNGHGSMLLYSVLFLLGCLSIEDIKAFRQLHSRTPGHPEYGSTPGVEVTTGPLGQGLGCAVGLAIAERILSSRLGAHLIDHYTYAMVGDGCLMEGISHEAASLAGHLGLSRLIVLFDSNGISIDGSTDVSTSDDVCSRFLSYRWDVQEVDGHNFDEIERSIARSMESDKPSIICCKTTIGKSMLAQENTSCAHGWPFTLEDLQSVRDALGWSCGAFEIPEEVRLLWRRVREKSEEEYKLWAERLKSSGSALSIKEEFSPGVPERVFFDLKTLKDELYVSQPREATRKSFGRVLEFLVERVPKLVGGSADLTSSNYTKASAMRLVNKDDFSASYIHYGVREHAMAACMNGMALYGGIIPYGGTFLVFSDYYRPSIRLSALMGVQVIYVATHDSIGVGEDGPTHQPVEHLASLRAIPGLYVFRPADAIEVLECWESALKLTESPSLFVLSRQNVDFMRTDGLEKNLSVMGAYILREFEGECDVTIFATGSELGVALGAREILQSEGVGTRVVSMPCWGLFEQQSKEYISGLLDNNSLKVAVEAAVSFGWHRYIGRDGLFIGLDCFGASGKSEDLYRHFGITKENVAQRVLVALRSDSVREQRNNMGEIRC